MAKRRAYGDESSGEESTVDSTVGSLENGGLTAEEKAAQDAANEPPTDDVKTAVAAAVDKVRVVASHLDDLAHRFDKGLPVTRQHIGDAKTHLDAAVQELVDAANL